MNDSVTSNQTGPRPRGVPGARRLALPSLTTLPALGMGFAAAGLTAAAGVAADRLSRDRRVASRLDEDLAGQQFVLEPDRELSVPVAHGVQLHVEVDEPRVVTEETATTGADSAGVDAAGVDVTSVDSPGSESSGPESSGSESSGGEPAGSDSADPDAPLTVVFSHGYCLSSLSWYFQRKAMREAGHRVVVWDQRGHGRSGTGPQEGYSIEVLGDDLAAVIAAAAPSGPLVLVGHSMGGMTMMSLALDHPDVLSRVVGAAFVATTPGNLSEVTYGLGTLAGRLIHRYGAGTTALLAKRQQLVDGTVRLSRDLMDYIVDFGSFASPVPLSVARLTTQMIFGTRMEVIAAFFPHFDEHDKREALGAFDGIETLVISGDHDRLTPPEHSEEIVRMLPGAEHVLVADAGHVIMLEHPRVLDRHLLDLVDRAQRARAHVPNAEVRPGAATDGAAVRTRTVRRRVIDVEGRAAAAQVRRWRRRS